jgi:Immunity protein 53
MSSTEIAHGGPFEFLMEWYLRQCDGMWEHSYGIEITTLDNPGWDISIDVIGTDMAQKNFEEISELESELGWYHCKLENGEFRAACGPKELGRVLAIFESWVLRG